jgi:hypothetical protein
VQRVAQAAGRCGGRTLTLTGLFMLLVLAMVAFSLRALARAWRTNHPTAHEEPYVALTGAAS